MTYRGHIQNGAVVLDDPVRLPEGSSVTLLVLPEQGGASPLSDYERLREFIGKAKGLPADLAANHDHYLHGQPGK